MIKRGQKVLYVEPRKTAYLIFLNRGQSMYNTFHLLARIYVLFPNIGHSFDSNLADFCLIFLKHHKKSLYFNTLPPPLRPEISYFFTNGNEVALKVSQKSQIYSW